MPVGRPNYPSAGSTSSNYYQRYLPDPTVVEAAITGDYNVAVQALSVDPTVPSPQVARNLLDEMLKLQKARFGPDHPDVARSLDDRATLRQNRGVGQQADGRHLDAPPCGR